MGVCSKSKRSKKNNKVIRSKPQLWERIKKKIKRGSKGGPPGKWSARKSQLAVKEYKKRGGKYRSKKNKCNSLTRWTKQRWDYVKGSSPKKHRGRYLPLKVRNMLTKKERSRENRLKGTKRGRKIKYSKSVLKKLRTVLKRE